MDLSVIRRILRKSNPNLEKITAYRRQGIDISYDAQVKYADISFEGKNRVGVGVKLSGRLSLGLGSFIGDYNYFVSGDISIGRYCSLAPFVAMYGSNHSISHLSSFHNSPLFSGRLKSNQEYKPITIGNDVWFGHGAIILPGVNIGDGAVVGAGSLISKDVAPFSIVVGNPQKEVRKRFPEKVIQALQNLKWWELPEDQLKKIEHLFYIDFNKDADFAYSEIMKASELVK